MCFAKINVSKVRVSDNHRPTDPEKVAAMARSLSVLGQLQPIGIRKNGDLVYGRHRLEAAISLGWKQIEAKTLELDDLLAEIATIDENLERSALIAIDEVRAVARRKELYEAMHPETRHGGDRKSLQAKEISNRRGGDLLRFSAEMAATTGISERVIQRDAAIGEALDPVAAEALRGTPIEDHKGQLQKLARLDAKEQRAVARDIKRGRATSVPSPKIHKAAADLPPNQEDDAGNEVPKALIPIFEQRSQFLSLVRRLTEIRGEIEQLRKTKAGKYLAKDDVVGYLNAAIKRIDEATPSTLDSDGGFFPKGGRK